MRYLLIALLATPFLWMSASCKKKKEPVPIQDATNTPDSTNTNPNPNPNPNNPNNPNNPPVDTPFNYLLIAADKIGIGENDTISFEVEFKDTGSKKELINLSLQGLPTGVTATFDTNNVEPPYKVIVKLISANATVGSYPITISATSSKTALLKMRQPALKVLPPCATRVAGTYTATSCRGGFGSFPQVLKEIAPNTLSTFLSDGHALTEVKMAVNCKDGKIVFISGLSGSGEFTDSTVILDAVEMNATCRYKLTR